MQPLFARANEALFQGLANYADVIRATIDELPRARSLCHQVVAEVRLVQALLAGREGRCAPREGVRGAARRA